MYLRSGPYEPSEKSYNLQEVGMLTEFCKLGYDCDLFYYGKHDKIQITEFKNGNKLTIHWIKGIRILRSGIYPQLLQKKRLSKYDFIICSEYSQIMTVLLSLLHRNVFCYNGPYYNLFKIKIVERIYDFLFVPILNERIKLFFCKSLLAENYLHGKGIKNTSVIGVGQNTDKFVIKENEIPSEDTTKILDLIDEFTFLFVGTLDDRKNFSFLIRSFKLAFKSNSKVKLLIIGKGKKKYIEKELAVLSKKERENIKIINFLPNNQLKFIYPKARALLLPSKLEIFGMVMLEAMSCGLPVISSFNGGSQCLIKSHENGIIADISNPIVWADSMLLLLDDSIYAEYSENSKETINNGFTWPIIIKKMEAEFLRRNR
ncbi:TPA: glycosyltransferase family 4 protein [Enterococcus faecium]